MQNGNVQPSSKFNSYHKHLSETLYTVPRHPLQKTGYFYTVTIWIV